MKRRKYPLFLITVTLLSIILQPQLWVEAQPSEAYIPVPHYYQVKSYYCGPAVLEMVFDYYGADVSQYEIADVARTSELGTFTPDMVRAAHFSNLSTSVGKESPLNFTGYTARKLGYASFERGGMTIEELKSLIAAGYPIIVLIDWHFRVAVGYNSTHIMFQDSLWPPNHNKTYSDFDFEWDYSGHWGLFVSPWKVSVSNARNVSPGEVFNVTATITYPCPAPFAQDRYPATAANATITLPDGLSLASGETANKTIGTGNLTAGASANVTWTVKADSLGHYYVSVEAEGIVNGFAPPAPPDYPPYNYEDRIGGINESIVVVTSSPDESPPITSDDYYDGLWHTRDFTINLTGTDDISGVMETYYKISNGPTRTLSLHGQPYIKTESANNTLEYWSVDWVGNEELPHKVLTEIKLDKTPPQGSVTISQNATYVNTTSVTLTVSAEDTTSGVAQMRLSNDNITWRPWETYNTSKEWTLIEGDGTKTVYIQFDDNAGLISTVYWDDTILDSEPPIIGIPTHTPDSNIQPDQEVKVLVNVTDPTSAVKNVTLSYRMEGNETWMDLPMVINSTSGFYETTIPGQNANALVKYRIVAYDNAENHKVDNNLGQYYTYTVVPEFPSVTILLLLMTATLLAVILYRRKH